MTKHPASLITRIHGAYRITMYGQQQHFLVMDALFHGMPEMAEVFDLKGSWVDRHAKRGAATLLDHDWPRSKHLNVSAAAADTMLKQAGHDARFFANCGVMDYSLLLGVHHVTEHRVLRERSGQLLTRRSLSSQGAMQGLLESPSVRATQSGALSAGGEAEGEGCVTPGGCVTPAAAPQLGADTTPFGSAASVAHELHEGPRSYSAVSLEGPGLYRLGIIDLLQRWNWKKRGERYAKVFFKCRCRESVREGMSVLEPRRYAVRFFESVGIKLLGYTLAQVRAVWAEQEEAIAREEQSRAEELSRAEGHSSPSRRPPTRAASATELAEWTGTGQPPCPEAWQ
jgi:1-phosphatidylinositol-4-phosphate 5-kinase